MNFLFWNVNKQNLNNTIIDLVIENDINILVLAEYNTDIEVLQRLFINAGKPMYFYRNLPGSERIKILTSFIQTNVERLRDDPHYLALRVPHEKLGYLNLFTVHFHSKLFRNDSDFNLKTMNMVNEVILVEESVGSDNTLICGDFNMNPFESGMMSAGRLHAFPTKIEARKFKRNFDYREYKTFYNPMWKYIGDDDMLGTYHHANPNSDGLYWNVFDQVIIRPPLIESLSDVKIIKKTNGECLGDENGIHLSDHLPIMFTIN